MEFGVKSQVEREREQMKQIIMKILTIVVGVVGAILVMIAGVSFIAHSRFNKE